MPNMCFHSDQKKATHHFDSAAAWADLDDNMTKLEENTGFLLVLVMKQPFNFKIQPPQAHK